MPVKIRKVILEDAKGIATVGIRTWQTTYRGLFPDEKLDTMAIEKSSEHWEKVIREREKKSNEMIIAEDLHDGIVGYANGGVFESTSPYDCEIAAVYVLKEFQRKGIGTQLVGKIIEYFLSQKWKSMIIWVLKENPYRKFYEKLGGIPEKKKLYEKWNSQHDLIGYVWENIANISV